jgi:hypothetical protein
MLLPTDKFAIEPFLFFSTPSAAGIMITHRYGGKFYKNKKIEFNLKLGRDAVIDDVN